MTGPKRGLFVGIAILAVGVILLLDQEGLVSADRIFRYFWPAIFIFFGAENILSSPPKSNRQLWGWILLVFGTLLLGSVAGIRFLRIQDLWPLVLIVAGVLIMARSFGWVSLDSQFWSRLRLNRSSSSSDVPLLDSQFDYVAVFGGVNQRISSKNFRGGSLLAFCGGWDLDLRRAEMDGDTAVIDANAFMGGGQIRVPDTWLVDMRGTAVLGGFSDETSPLPPVSGGVQKRLILKGTTVFGGVVVKN
ncbi:MAG TPA: DUF5668 domain-containing protein [Candidatus Acidoferrum sp.]|nr:DUF5668 domain-containing protein [Candidatus Acidoferrum sp.]